MSASATEQKELLLQLVRRSPLYHAPLRTTTLNQLVRWGGQEGLLDYTSRQLDGLKYCCEFLDESLPWHTSPDHRKFYEDLERILGDITVRRQAAVWACVNILTGANPCAGQRQR